MKHLLATLLLLLSAANAATIAILEITIASDDEIDFTIDETKFLSDELRRQAALLLPNDYSVLTREKIISLAQQTSEDLSTVLDIGRAIKSEYVTQGSISKLGGIYTLTVELYETQSGKLLGYFTKESPDLKGFLDVIRENSPSIFARIMPKEEPPAIAIPETVKDTQLVVIIPTNIPDEPEKSNNSLWVAIGLDVLGATAFGLGIYNNAKLNGYYNECKNILKNIPDPYQYPEQYEEQYEKADRSYAAKFKKMQNAGTTRNIFYITGGALLLGGVVVHIWF
jgi:hypothetical protein